MQKMCVSLLLLAFALSGCWVSIRPHPPVVVSAPPPPPPSEVLEPPMPPVAFVAQEPAPQIVFNQPVYYPPPLVVSYTYDHWMYVVNGPFVDIVFIDYHGVRHVEHWRHGGARMTKAQLPEWHRSYHVPRGAVQVHNEKLREYAVKHPGSVKHQPEPAIRSTNLPVKKFSETPVQNTQSAPPIEDSRIGHPGKPVERQSPRGVEKWETVQEKPTKGSKQMTTVHQEAPTAPNGPATVQSPTTSAKEATMVHKKPETAPKTPATMQQPTTSAKQATTVQENPAPTSREQKTVHQMPPTSSKQPPNLHEKGKTASRESSVIEDKKNGEEKKNKGAKKPNKPEKKSTAPEKRPGSDSK